MKLIGYVGTRQIQQFLAVPLGAQIPATSSGGVVDLDRQFGGLGLRWIYRNSGERPLILTAGIDYDASKERRKGYNNFAGSALGVLGDLRRNEDNIVTSFAQYIQGEWQLAHAWSLVVGVRNNEVKFKSEDFFISNTNPDDSGGDCIPQRESHGGIALSCYTDAQPVCQRRHRI